MILKGAEKEPPHGQKRSPADTRGTDGTFFNITALVTGISNSSQRYPLIFGLPASLPHGLKCLSTNPSAFVNPPPVISLTSSPEFVSGESLSGLRHDVTSFGFLSCTNSQPAVLSLR
jgi:hypothetical protein